MPNKREIIYPYFLECCQYCDDVFWESIFEELSYGKAPYGTYISKGFLTCSYKNKEFQYKLERKSPEQLYNEVYQLLTEKLGVLSQKEKAHKRIAFQEMEKNIRQTRQDWATIRKKNVKDVMYEMYAIDIMKKHSLSIKQCRYFLALITIAIMFKIITAKDIVYKDDRIQHIEGVVIKGRGEAVLTRPFLCSVRGNTVDLDEPVEEEEIVKMMDNWTKFIKTLKDEKI